jgi:hypothetical protein
MPSIAARPAGAAARAGTPRMSPAAAWQVAWTQVTVTSDGLPVTCWRGELLPETTVPAELAERNTLGGLGALRRVAAYSSAAEVRAAASAAASAGLDKTGLPASANPVPSVLVAGRFLAGPAT